MPIILVLRLKVEHPQITEIEHVIARLIGVPEVSIIPKNFRPFNLQAGKMFKITNGQIHGTEANGTMLPYGASCGWEDN